MSCSTEALSGLVDGALSHDERERVHAHLAGCASCRADVEQQRALKARLRGLAAATPPPPADLVGRLQRLAVPGVEPSSARPVPLPVGGTRPTASRPVDRRPPGRPQPAGRARRVRRTGAVGSGLLLVGVGLALVLGGAPSTAPSTPVDPGSDAFVVDFVGTTSDVPLADPAARAALLPVP